MQQNNVGVSGKRSEEKLEGKLMPLPFSRFDDQNDDTLWAAVPFSIARKV